MTDLLLWIKDFGIQIVVTIAVLYGGWQLVCRMLGMLESANKRWQDVVDKLTATLDLHRQQVKEEHQYQRTEHKEFAAQLQNATEEQAKQADVNTKALQQVESSLGRINGYKDGH